MGTMISADPETILAEETAGSMAEILNLRKRFCDGNQPRFHEPQQGAAVRANRSRVFGAELVAIR